MLSPRFLSNHLRQSRLDLNRLRQYQEIEDKKRRHGESCHYQEGQCPVSRSSNQKTRSHRTKNPSKVAGTVHYPRDSTNRLRIEFQWHRPEPSTSAIGDE